MKILQIVPTLMSGGAEKFVTDLSIHLHQENEIKILCLFRTDNTDFYHRLDKNKINVEFLNKKRGFDLRCMYNVFKEIKDYSPDVIHCHLDSIKYCSIPGFLLKKKVFYTVHNLAEKDSQKISRWLYLFAFKVLNVKPIAICEKVRKSISKVYKIPVEQIPLIYNGICLKEIDSVSGYKKQNDSLINLFNVAAFRKQKNHKLLIDIFEQLFYENNKFRLNLIGDGEVKSEIIDYVSEKKLNDYVNFLGNRNDVYSLMKTYDVFILTSDYEGFSIAVLEAMACGNKIVATDVGGNNEQIINHVTGILFNKGDILSGINAVNEIISSDINYGENASKYIRENFTLDTCAQKYIDLFQNYKEV